MTSWTERYLEAALKSIPAPKRTDVERELRSSIGDAIEERVAAGEDRQAAERTVLEGLGDPAQLAAAYTGRPNYLIGPELFPILRWFVPRLIGGVVPIVAIIVAAVSLASGESYGDAVGAAISAAITVAIQIAFWTTLTFVFLERADAARQAREGLVEMTRTWTLERLPEPAPGRVTASEAVGEVISALLTIGGLIFLLNLGATSSSGVQIPLLEPALNNFWLPVFIAVLAALAVLQVIVYMAGRWTMTLAVVAAALNLAFAVPLVWLALKGTLVNPAFAEHIGYPPLAEGDAPVMLAIAVFATLVTAWEIVGTFLRARGGRKLSAVFGAWRRST